MSNFKSGSGNLDFGDGSDENAPNEEESSPRDRDAATDQTDATPGDATTAPTDRTSDGDPTGGGVDDTESEGAQPEYPYFVRRRNVGDERDNRLELHVRDKVARRESAFRNDLAAQLDTAEVSKTDAREFALLAAYHHPDLVAELMEAEGFGTLE
jgi:hypothetical protein